MKKIGYLSFYPDDASSFYRTCGVLPYINSDEFELINLSRSQNFSSISFIGLHALIIQRPNENRDLQVIRAAKDVGLKIISDHDDDTLHLDLMNPMHDFFEAGKQNIIDALTLSDEVWVGTEATKKSYRLYNKNIHVIPNALNDQIFPVSKKPEYNFNKKVMYRGGFSHEGDIYDEGTPEMILELINGNCEYNFYFLGQRFKYIEKRLKHLNHFRHDGASTVQFYKIMNEINPCIFFYPLENNLFNRSKSSCSFLEATYAGAAFFGNTELPEFNKPGISDLRLLNKAVKEGHVKYMKDKHNEAWRYIQDNLLLSDINKIRKERLESI